MEALARLGGPTWFRLGDRDLATNVERTRRLRAGETLSEVTRDLCARLGVRHAVVPMSDDPVRTLVHTDRGALEFQHYFVRDRCEPRVQRLEYRGAESARPSAALREALGRGAGVIFCPSNPYLSIAPILAVPGIREAIGGRAFAVSPIIAGRAVKGPAAKIMQELGIVPSALEVARYYRGIVRALMIDRADAALAAPIEALGIRAVEEDTLMTDETGRARLAHETANGERRGGRAGRVRPLAGRGRQGQSTRASLRSHPANGPGRSSRVWGWRSMCPSTRPSFPAVRSSACRSPGLWPWTRR
jgi:LPPG:FO 2-phospho-L-lactate transferase